MPTVVERATTLHSTPLLALLIMSSLIPRIGSAQEPVTSARIPVKIVAGRLVALCDLSTRFRRIPGNLVIDFENPCTLQLHNRAAGALRAESRSGQTTPITIHFSRFKITIPKREHGPEDFYNDITKWYSKELGENAVLGTIGARLLKNYRVTFDLNAGYMHLDKPREPGTKPENSDQENVVELPVTVSNDIVWLPARLPDGKPTAMAVGTANFDSTIDRDLCDDLGFPAGNLKPIRVGKFDLSGMFALRPAEITFQNKDGALGVLGLNVWKHFRIEVDRVNRTAYLTPTAEAKYSAADLAFFAAMVDEDTEALEAFLAKYPEARLSNEAAELMTKLNMEDDAELDSFKKSITWVIKTTRMDLRTSKMLELMKELEEGGYADAAVFAGQAGIPSARKDRYPDSVHKLHANIGRLLLDSDKDKQAWRHLLSAAFGLPQDGMINLQLGRFYERQKRYNRATSRYVQAVISAESGPQAMEGLQRVHKATGGKQRMSVELIERLIAGKTYGFGAANKFEPKENEQTNRVALVEFFTNGHLKVPNIDAGAVGGALGNEGIMSHFPRSRVAMLSYHLPAPELEPLVNEVSLHAARTAGVSRPTIQVVNGRRRGPGAGKAREGEQIYNAVKRQVKDELTRASEYQLKLDAKVNDEGVSGTLEVSGPANENAIVQIILAERGVLFPGRSKVVIHRMVARTALTPDVTGTKLQMSDGKMEVSFRRKFAEIKSSNEAFLDRLEQQGAGVAQKFATSIDPRQVTIVAFVRDSRSSEVLQATQFIPPAEDQ